MSSRLPETQKILGTFEGLDESVGVEVHAGTVVGGGTGRGLIRSPAESGEGVGGERNAGVNGVRKGAIGGVEGAFCGPGNLFGLSVHICEQRHKNDGTSCGEGGRLDCLTGW